MIEGKIKITGIERKEIRFIEIEGGDREAMMIVCDVDIEDMILEKEGATKIQKIIKEGEAMTLKNKKEKQDMIQVKKEKEDIEVSQVLQNL